MKSKQKKRHAAALISICLLCISTILVFPAAANEALNNEPIGALFHLRISLSDMSQHYDDIQTVPDAKGIDPENPDYWILIEELSPCFSNGVIVGTTSSGSKFIYQSDIWKLEAIPSTEEPHAYLSFDQAGEDALNVFKLCFSQDPGASYIYSDLPCEYYTQLDIYIQPQFSYTPTPSYTNVSDRDLQMIAYLGSCGFQFASPPYPDIGTIRNDAYNEGRLAGYDEGYSAGTGDLTESYQQGYQEGLSAGRTEALNGTGTLKEMIFAIFSAPSELINGFLDFDLLGINVASFVKTLLTLSITALIVYGILKLTKG